MNRGVSITAHLQFQLLLAAVLLFLFPVSLHAQSRATDLVTWSVKAEPAAGDPSNDVRLSFHADIENGWKVYAMGVPRPPRAITITLDTLAVGISQESSFTQSQPLEGYDPFFAMDVRYFRTAADIQTLLTVDPSAGEQEVSGSIEFMVCNDVMCFPPTRVPFTVPVSATAATTGQVSASLTGDATIQEPGIAVNDLNAARAGGLWRFILLAIGAGLAALLTPCVFPMIPLTVSYFTRHAHARGEAIRMATVYGMAVVVTFTSLGILTALLLGAAGAQTIAANPWINLFIGTVFVIFALSLLGLFELRLPNGLINYFNRQSTEKAGYAGVLFMGLTLTLVSFSCTAPFVGGLLAATAHGERAYPVLGMLAFSLTFALPFILFALFPRALGKLPQSGAWMNAVKVVLGFVELAAALKFLSNADLIWGWGVISRPLAIAVTVVIFLLAGAYLLGKLRLAHEPPVEQVGVFRLLFSISFFGLALYMLPGLFGAPLNKLDAYLPPRQGTDLNLFASLPAASGGAATDGLPWHTDDIESAFVEAAQLGKPVFIDFTGYTCTNCREMEANVFTRPEVHERFQRDFVLLRLYTDGLERGQDFQRYQLQTTGTVALPTYAVVDPAGQELIARETGVVPLSEFVQFLDEGAALYRDRSLAVF
jgi:thiol:disulfide interchange protein